MPLISTEPNLPLMWLEWDGPCLKDPIKEAVLPLDNNVIRSFPESARPEKKFPCSDHPVISSSEITVKHCVGGGDVTATYS